MMMMMTMGVTVIVISENAFVDLSILLTAITYVTYVLKH
jgi:hypothetical protein